MIKSFYNLLIVSCLCVSLNACTSTKNPKKKELQEHELEKRQEDFDEHYERHHYN